MLCCVYFITSSGFLEKLVSRQLSWVERATKRNGLGEKVRESILGRGAKCTKAQRHEWA